MKALMNNKLKVKMEKTKQENNKKLGILPRGRSFKGDVIRVVGDRVAISFERLLYLRKYERYEKRRTKLQAKIPKEFSEEIQQGDYIEISECRPISKGIHFVVTKKIRSKK